MALLDDVHTFLTAQSLDTGHTVFKNYIGTTPDKIITLNETGGFPPDQFTSAVGEMTFQVMVRGEPVDKAGSTGPVGPRDQIIAIIDGLNKGGVANTVFVQAIQSGPLFLGYDENERPQFACNFTVRKEL